MNDGISSLEKELDSPSDGGGMEQFAYAQIERFKKEHPASRGWKTYRLTSFSQRTEPPIILLPAFLRSRMKPVDYQENITAEMYYSSGEYPRYRLTGLPRRQRGRGLTERNWSGNIRVNWNKTPIHVRRILFPSKGWISHLTLFASKDWSALEKFWHKISTFEKAETVALFKRRIFVINGSDYARPKIGWDRVVLPAGMAEQIRENFEAFLVAKPKYREMGIAYRRGFLFTGPPGNGKTLVVRALASEYPVNVATLNLTSDTNEGHVESLFNMARAYFPCMIILEDIDKLGNHAKISLPYILNLMDGFKSNEGIIMVATTNEPEKLDPALIHRPSRFDRVWEFKLPEEPERLRLLRLKGARYFSEEALHKAAADTEGFSMAYVQEAVVSALMASIHDGVSPGDKHLETAVSQLRSQIKTALHGSKSIGAPREIGFALERNGS